VGSRGEREASFCGHILARDSDLAPDLLCKVYCILIRGAGVDDSPVVNGGDNRRGKAQGIDDHEDISPLCSLTDPASPPVESTVVGMLRVQCLCLSLCCCGKELRHCIRGNCLRLVVSPF